jgi:hypothetical protein
MRIPIALATAVLALVAGPAVRADTVDVTSTTMLQLGQQTRGGVPFQPAELDTVAPLFEILSITARGVTNPIADDLSIIVSTWGSYDFADLRWNNGTTSSLTGEVVTGYVQGRFLDRRLLLRIGREHVMTGVARMIHIDGGEATAFLPYGLRVSGYAGVPVSQRFTRRTAIENWNPIGGDRAFGGRLAWSLAQPGTPGRGLDLGASVNIVEDGSDPVRREIGADFRVLPMADVVVTGSGAYDIYAERFSELALRAGWRPLPRLQADVDARYVAPDLFLSRNSILSVFSAERRRELGAAATYEVARGLSAGAAYRLRLEPGETEEASDRIGHQADARVEWRRGVTLAGAELGLLDALENGYFAVRLFGRRDLGRLFAAADVLGHFFRESVNGEDLAVTGTLTAGMDLARGFSAVVSGRAGMTPFLEQTYDVMAKLVYNASYRIREVR